MARYALTFEQSDGVNGAAQLDLFGDHASYWVYLDLRDDGFVAIRHDDVPLPRGSLLEVRADGLWAELVCEVPGEHWSFGLEAFGLRLDDRDEARTAEVGERVPVGFDLEWDTGKVIGELLVGKARNPFDGRGAFEQVTGEPVVRTWADFLELPR
ncbi:MAG: hypothetical protein WD271_14035 [Acidimicrobiia bacterium]